MAIFNRTPVKTIHISHDQIIFGQYHERGGHLINPSYFPFHLLTYTKQM